ncbi:MAG: protein-glutamate O-methyltransferase CheR [Alphaproteobacteria bacterium]|nr:protein-glutamate O-methyltransferase CheR [Alphaproteobacteria bacterium]
MRKQDFSFLLNLLKDNAGWEFNETQYFIIDKKMNNFIREKNYNSIEDLITDLQSGNKQLIAQVVEAMAFSDTSFYRNYDVFYQFENVTLPKLKEKCRATKKLNIWSLGCSTGQEAYSIAMSIDKNSKLFYDWNVNILASDLSSLAISKAQHGVYSYFEVQNGLNAKNILNYFHQTADAWEVSDKIKKMIEFRRYNLLDEAIVKSKFELVFCRNVLRYFTPELQDNLLKRISEKQPQGGYLYLGKGEIIPAIEKYYHKIDNNGTYMAMGNSKADTSAGNLSVSNVDSDALPSFVKPKGL